MITKSDITKSFNELRKYGYLVFNFSHNKPVSKGNAGWVDIVVIGKGYVIFIETKIGKDKPSPEQLKTKDNIENTYGWVHYFTVTETNYKEVVLKILTKDL